MDLPKHWDTESVTQALDALSDLVLWELTPQRWEQVAEVLHQIETALDTHDLDDLRDATSALELYGPYRKIPRIGSAGAAGIPPQVLERRNELVHRLTGDPKHGKPEEARDDDDQRAS
ncbi:hypothetical protein GCM10010168_45930 [Actinoplanes ianthinogenes]|uniref:CATRA-Associated Small Protein domain-containing protein n=1 Tax=Actinoplanes ianthinogenes TaxID=122358 RepID=A0ABM7LPA2_9ACTN|nr:CATRA system-associated protein [Actinoplanes ianthinogenes]BCJ41109.1 hypothetical protein Aiant_17660 [Actinoplanes ianthinogenes]GGR22855.1 hypothetical protein GCM10010168_45930 [Actinoplanes ianthinogenes]